MELWELNTCYGRRWIVQSATALELAEYRTWSKGALSWKEMLRADSEAYFCQESWFLLFCALNTANSIIDLQGEDTD